MKKEIIEILDWCKGGLKKYSIPIFILVALWFGLKSLWYWMIMPILLAITFKFFAGILNWKWVDRINVVYLIIAWVFIFSVFKKLGKMMFEDD
jgi:hypothetical protein